MPKLGIAEADDQVHDEESQEQPFDRQEIPAAVLPFLAQLIALVISKQPTDEDDQPEDQCDR